jgi:hypothetical protein
LGEGLQKPSADGERKKAEKIAQGDLVLRKKKLRLARG